MPAAAVARVTLQLASSSSRNRARFSLPNQRSWPLRRCTTSFLPFPMNVMAVTPTRSSGREALPPRPESVLLT